ncbi:MAG: response regulator transcription factor [Anaerolineales bacterium]|jgi:DNA-binding NarL/FixJ family response regulator
MRILIVDNQSRARLSMKALMGVWYPAAEIREAADGYEAVELAEKFQPDVILMDARMPKMNGLEAVRHIKAKSHNIKIIVLSMYTDIKEEALAAGADAFISKSDPPEKIRELMKEIFSGLEPKY